MKTVSSKKIEAVIFDLGQVIVKVDHQETFKPLTQILKIDQDAVMKLFKSEAYFLFELGKISEDQFFSQIHKAIPAPLMATIKEAWDAMIVDIPLDGISALRKLQNKIPLFALSNTNTSHVSAINRLLANQYNIKDIKSLFDKVYYSHELNLGKPDKKIFEHVLRDAQLEPSKVLFVDDNSENIEVAIDLGFQIIHLKEQLQLLSKLKQFRFLSTSINWD